MCVCVCVCVCVLALCLAGDPRTYRRRSSWVLGVFVWMGRQGRLSVGAGWNGYANQPTSVPAIRVKGWILYLRKKEKGGGDDVDGAGVDGRGEREKGKGKQKVIKRKQLVGRVG
jgi:hypothetical protein